MRILLSFVGGSGHFEPLVPIARAAETFQRVLLEQLAEGGRTPSPS